MRGAAVALALLASLAAGGAAAHTRSVSYSVWQLDAAGARVTARVSQLDLSRLGLAYLDSGGPDDPVAGYLASRLHLWSDAERCRVTGAPTRRDAGEGWTLYRWRVACPDGSARAIESDLFLDVAPSHLHFARVSAEGAAGIERVLSEATPRWTLGDEPEAAGATDGGGTGLAGYLLLGVEHILTGTDHLVFVLALLLLAGTFGEVAALVTAFTVAHSVTLALAALGLVRPEAAAIEALIGFSIALVAVENGWILAGRDRLLPWLASGFLGLLALLPGGAVPVPALLGLALFTLCHFALLRASPRPARLRAAVAFAFGLVHGFGFAGVLAALELGAARLLPALFGFNVGVELGQLAVVALVWPLLRLLARHAAASRWAVELGSAAVCALGSYWFLVRHFG